jgi:hypothetical protein
MVYTNVVFYPIISETKACAQLINFMQLPNWCKSNIKYLMDQSSCMGLYKDLKRFTSISLFL